MKKVKHLQCTSCHMIFEQIGSKFTPNLVFGLCPLCGEEIQKNQLLTEADQIVNEAIAKPWKLQQIAIA